MVNTNERYEGKSADWHRAMTEFLVEGAGEYELSNEAKLLYETFIVWGPVYKHRLPYEAFQAAMELDKMATGVSYDADEIYEWLDDEADPPSWVPGEPVIPANTASVEDFRKDLWGNDPPEGK